MQPHQTINTELVCKTYWYSTMSREAAKQQACRADVLNTLPSLTESLAEFTAKDDVNVINAVIR